MIDFPANPTVGQTFTSGAQSWTWDGAKWVASGVYVGPPQFSNANRIINGDMRIDQRGVASGAGGTAAGYTVDRWRYLSTQASKGTWTRANFGVGFPYALQFGSSSAYAVLASDTFYFQQIIEADMVSDFQWGSSNAQPVTLSFWALSSLAGTFGGAIKAADSSRSYPFSYSLSNANQATKIAVTIPGDTAGTWVMSGNAASILVNFDLGTGATFRGPANAWAATNYNGVTGAASIVATNSATFYVTGVKLEIGSVATPFNRKSPQESLADCQRYFSTSYSGVAVGSVSGVGSVNAYQSGLASATNVSYLPMEFPVTMRAVPTVTCYSPTTGASGKGRDAQNNTDVTPSVLALGYSNGTIQMQSSAAAANIYFLVHYTASAEL